MTQQISPGGDRFAEFLPPQDLRQFPGWESSQNKLAMMAAQCSGYCTARSGLCRSFHFECTPFTLEQAAGPAIALGVGEGGIEEFEIGNCRT